MHKMCLLCSGKRSEMYTESLTYNETISKLITKLLFSSIISTVAIEIIYTSSYAFCWFYSKGYSSQQFRIQLLCINVH